jgi:S1-C subfamily serine protease
MNLRPRLKALWSLLPLFVAFLAVAIASPGVLAGGFDRAIEATLPRVVKLYGLGAGMQRGYGSGVLVSRDGLVLTVYSLLVDADTVRAVLADGTMYESRVVFHDRERQLSLLRLMPLASTGDRNVRLLDATFTTTDGSSVSPEGSDVPSIGPFPYFDILCDASDHQTGEPRTSVRADSQRHEPAVHHPDCSPDLNPGDWVLAAGNAFKVADGEEPVSIAHGVFSARTRLDARRRMRDFPYHGEVLVIDAITSNPGAPGSALVNLDGEFVGLVGREVVSNLTYTHFNYAIPLDVLVDFLTEALEAEKSGRFYAQKTRDTEQEPVDPGIRLSRAGFRTVLPFVERVVRDSPADRVGVRKDDLVLSVNGRNVSNAEEYFEQLRRVPPGEAINIVLRRDRRIITVQIGAVQQEEK